MAIEKELLDLLNKKRREKKKNFNRHVTIQDLLSNIEETAKFYNFCIGTTLLNNVKEHESDGGMR